LDQTSFEKIQSLALLNFGRDPGMSQVRMWWFGCSRGKNRDYQSRIEWPQREVGPWEVVIKLAIRYTREMVAKSGRRWDDGQIWSFIYWLLWKSELVKLEKRTGPTGDFMGQTFWGWAAERRNSEAPTIGKKARRDFVKALKNALKSMEDEFEEAT